MRKKIIAGNWKMNKTPQEAVELVNSLKDSINTDKVDVVLCPSFVCFYRSQLCVGSGVRLFRALFCVYARL